jgi:hypothetical protein
MVKPNVAPEAVDVTMLAFDLAFKYRNPVIVLGDDPGANSSQNEQDNRTLAKFGRVPCLEPSDSQEAKECGKQQHGQIDPINTEEVVHIELRNPACLLLELDLDPFDLLCKDFAEANDKMGFHP